MSGNTLTLTSVPGRDKKLVRVELGKKLFVFDEELVVESVEGRVVIWVENVGELM